MLRTLKSYRERNPLIAVLLLLNLVVGIGWVTSFGLRWFEARKLSAAQLDETLKINERDGGINRDDAQRVHDIGIRAMLEKHLNEDDLAYLANRLDQPNPPGKDSVFAKVPYIAPLLDAKMTPQGQRTIMTPALIRFLEREPVTPYDTSAYLAARALMADKSPSAVQEFKRLQNTAVGRRRETFDDAVKREAGIKVMPHK